MKTFITLPLVYLAGRKLRTALTTLAIVFGVAVIFAVNTLLPTMIAALQSGLLGISGLVDLTIASATGETFDATALAVAQQTNGVAN